MSSRLLPDSFLVGLFVAFIAFGAQAQDDDFSDVELDDTEISEEDFDDVEFDDEEFDDEEFADEEFGEPEEIDVDEEEFAEEEPLEEDPGSEEFAEEDPFDEPIEDVEEVEELVEEPLEESIDEPLPEDLTPPAVAEEDLFSSPVGPDEPNLDYEAKLHDIYTKFHKEKTNEEAWMTVVGQRITEVYTIQKDDKLWEISRTLFGDGNYWPKVWSLNSRIRNPHLIRPKNQIQFVLGDESGPPAFSISEEEEEVEEEEAEEEVEEESEEEELAEEEANQPEIPPPTINSRAVVKRLPPSLPRWQSLGEQIGEFDELGIDYGTRKITELDNRIPLAAYVSERGPDPIGTISEVEAGSRIASTLQYLYVEMDSGTAQVGDTLLVIRNRGEVEQAHPSVTGFLGYSIEIQGEVQLVERIPRKSDANKRRRRRRGKQTSNRELYRAIVSRLVNPVSVGSALIPGRVEYIEISEKGPRSQVVAQFVGGQYFNKRQVYGTESVAYLNRGSEDGLAIGQILSVRENRTIRNENTLVRSNVRPIGWVRVVKVEPSMATVVVVKAWSDIVTGDITGAGQFVPRDGVDDGSLSDSTETASRTLLEELDELPSGAASPEQGDAEEEDDFGDEEFDDDDDEDFGE